MYETHPGFEGDRRVHDRGLGRPSWAPPIRSYFEEKFWDVIGLYLAPPDKALVLCCDEKRQVQALEERTHGRADEWVSYFENSTPGDVFVCVSTQRQGNASQLNLALNLWRGSKLPRHRLFIARSIS